MPFVLIAGFALLSIAPPELVEACAIGFAFFTSEKRLWVRPASATALGVCLMPKTLHRLRIIPRLGVCFTEDN